MRNRLMGVCLTFAAFAVLAGCASTEVTPDAVAVADTAVAPAPDRGHRPALVTVPDRPDRVAVPAPDVVTVPEPTVVDTAVAVDDTPATEEGPTVDTAVPAEDMSAPEGESPEEPREEPEGESPEEPEYVSPEEGNLPPVDETVTMDCVDWGQADGLAYEDAAALCDALSSEGYPTSDLTHEEYEWNFTDQAERQGL
jgi:hypothetical protein